MGGYITPDGRVHQADEYIEYLQAELDRQRRWREEDAYRHHIAWQTMRGERDAALAESSKVTDETAQLFLGWMEGVFTGTPDAMRLAVKQAMTKALEGEACPYAVV